MDVLLHYFKQNKSEHIFLYFIATLNKFSPILKYVNQSDMINNHNKMQKEYDSDYLIDLASILTEKQYLRQFLFIYIDK